MRASLVTPLISCLFLVWSGSALAQSMDPAVDRLVDPARQALCRVGGKINLPENPTPAQSAAYQPCLPDNAAFHRLAAQYGFAFAPTAMHAASTTGVGGWHVAIEAAYTSIDSGAAYWKDGSRGSASLGDGNTTNSNPAGVLQLYSFKLRKAFGYGIEMGAQTGFMPQTSLWNAGVDIRWSLFEGFRTGIPGYIPDFAVGGGVRTITGTHQFQLTIASFDTQLSKRIRVADAVVLTPWIGYQHLWTFIDSNVIDMTPGTNQEQLCNPLGQAVPGQLTDPKTTANDYTGKVVCSPNGSGADFNNNRAFGGATVIRQRLLIGTNIRHEHLMFGLQFITDLVKPADAQTGDMEKADLAGMPRQWTAVLDAGLIF